MRSPFVNTSTLSTNTVFVENVNPSINVTRGLEAALHELKATEGQNCNAIAIKYNVEPQVLSRRYRKSGGILKKGRRHLTDAQDQVLIAQINQLADEGHPTSFQVIANMARAICGRGISREWSAEFVNRHAALIKNIKRGGKVVSIKEDNGTQNHTGNVDFPAQS